MNQPTFNDKGKTTCQSCRQVGEVFQRSSDDKWVCFNCLPARDVDRYPGWRKRMQTKRQRAAQARANFGA